MRKKKKPTINKNVLIALLMFQGLKRPTIQCFLTSDTTKLSEMEVVADVLKMSEVELILFLEKIREPELISNYVATPIETSLYYQGRIDATKALGILREIYWRLSQKEARNSKPLLKSLSLLKNNIGETVPFGSFCDIIYSNFDKSVNLQAFKSKIENNPLIKKGGFKSAAKKEAVTSLLKNINQMKSRHLAIQLMGAAVQLHWPKAALDEKKLEFFMIQIEENIEFIKSSPAESLRGIDEHVETFDMIFGTTFFKQQTI